MKKLFGKQQNPVIIHFKYPDLGHFFFHHDNLQKHHHLLLGHCKNQLIGSLASLLDP